MRASLHIRLHRLLLRCAYQGMRVYWRVLRPRTHGACVAVWSAGDLLLVRHSYKPGLGLPAGGVGRRESSLEAAVRELREEVGIQADPGALRPAGRMVSREHGNEDHLEFFELHCENPPAVQIDGREIVWAGFTSLEEALGGDLHPGVRRWLAEQGRTSV